MSDDSTDSPMGAGGLDGLLQQAMQMQQRVQQAQERAASQTVTGEAAGGLVKVAVNGKMEISRIDIDPKVVDPTDVEMLADLVAAATNDGLTRARQLMQNELGPLARMLKAGGLGGLGGLG